MSDTTPVGREAMNLESAAAAACKGVWVLAELKNGSPLETTYELLGAGRPLADTLNTPLTALLFGDGVAAAADLLIARGADTVYVVEDPALAVFNDEVYTAVAAQLVEAGRPEILLISASAYGRSLAPRLATRLNTGLAADCTQLTIDPEQMILLQTRPVYSGSLLAAVVCPERRPQMATVRPRAMKALPADPGRTGQVVRPAVTLPERRQTRVVDVVVDLAEKISLNEAEVIVAGGRGLGEAKNFALLAELADVLNGAVGASRAVVDSGWIAYSQQVGQTGKTVAPRLYLACGISGADQHLAGMSSSDIIIAINKDPEAPIFKMATYGIVGDVLEVVPALIRELRSRQS
jgi:electron transfer flavoprotein alpha subunit